MMEYVDSDGRVPRGMTEVDNATMLKTLLLTAIALANGGSIEVTGFDTPERARLLMTYELKVSGRGNGTILIEAVRKDQD